MLKPVALLFCGNVKIQYEGSVESLVASGRVGFVISALDDVVMYVVVAKKDGFDQGKAAIYATSW